MSDDTFSQFNRILACDRQTDEQTDGQISYDSIIRIMNSIVQ